MKIGFIGLGNMGRPMAANLIEAGHDVTLYNRSRARAEEIGGGKAGIADTPAAAAEGAEAVVTMLADDDAVEAVTLGPDGLLAALPQDAVHISMSTISVELSRLLTDAHSAVGRTFVSAPVLGRPEVAASAMLFIVAAGPGDAIERCSPLFESIGQRVFTVGEHPWQANVLKLCSNFLVVSAIEAMGEAFALTRKAEIDPEIFRQVIAEGIFQAPAYQAYSTMIAADTYEPAGFWLPLGLKDTRLALQAAEALDVPLPTASLIRDQFLTALARGYENFDWGALGRVAADNAGLKPKK